MKWHRTKFKRHPHNNHHHAKYQHSVLCTAHAVNCLGKLVDVQRAAYAIQQGHPIQQHT